MRKKVILVLILALNISMFTGCWNYVEIDQQINVSGLGVDVGREGKKYHLSAEVVAVGKKEKGEMTVAVIETDSDTVFEGIRNLMTLTSKKLYFGHCKTLIIGQKTAKKGIADILDMTIRNHELRKEMDIVISKDCDARDILMTEGISTPIMSYKIYDLLKTIEKSVGVSMITKAYMIFNSLQSEGVSTVIPALEISRVEDQKVLKLNGGAVFCEDRLSGFIDELQVKDLSFLNDEIIDGLLTVESADNSGVFMSFEIYKSNTKRKLRSEGELSVDISTNTAVIIGESAIEDDYTKPEEVEKARRLLEKNLEAELARLVETAQSLKCDLLGVGAQMSRDNPIMWEKYKENWEETFSGLKINIDCKIVITGSGIDNVTLKKSSNK